MASNPPYPRKRTTDDAQSDEVKSTLDRLSFQQASLAKDTIELRDTMAQILDFLKVRPTTHSDPTPDAAAAAPPAKNPTETMHVQLPKMRQLKFKGNKSDGSYWNWKRWQIASLAMYPNVDTFAKASMASYNLEDDAAQWYDRVALKGSSAQAVQTWEGFWKAMDEQFGTVSKDFSTMTELFDNLSLKTCDWNMMTYIDKFNELLDRTDLPATTTVAKMLFEHRAGVTAKQLLSVFAQNHQDATLQQLQAHLRQYNDVDWSLGDITTSINALDVKMETVPPKTTLGLTTDKVLNNLNAGACGVCGKKGHYAAVCRSFSRTLGMTLKELQEVLNRKKDF